MPEFLRKANQLTEMMILAGPGDEEVGILRQQYGYRPEAMTEVEASRLEWEAASCNGSLRNNGKDGPPAGAPGSVQETDTRARSGNGGYRARGLQHQT